MFNSKTFRLFISSTFSDFKREREVLQGKVFPHIKAYAAQYGYTFQPIDLRWGVNNEAQLDQKTLELCLDEVKACKTFKHPNFLVMLGDRYGWIPLPYAIEVQEFETLCALMTEQEKKDLTNWYAKDLNQLPASYILQERSGEFEAFERWEKEEAKLRGILQSAAETTLKDSKINSDQRKKYFTSATEAEVEEGIISYLKPTPSQNALIEGKQTTPEIDAQHIFGFFRSIEPISKMAETFIADGIDQEKARDFGDKVSKVLPPKNRLHREVKQIEKGKLDETYLQTFQERVTQFLKSKIDEQKKQEDKQSLSPLQIEREEQKYFAQSKRKNFLGQEEALEKIEKYISGDEEQPLIIYGKSGSGKSALMAQAIEKVKESNTKKVLYRFVGATANSSTSVDILTSLFSELGIEIHDEDSRDLALIEKSDNKETFEQFSLRVHQEFSSIRGEVAIFIDAVDQLQSADYFLWLPKILPPNVKIVISALKDDEYAEDSQYFNDLSVKTINQYAIPEFNDAPKLIRNLLKGEGRALQPEQERYLLKQYEIKPSPLYIRLAIQEAKQWCCIVNIKNENVKNEAHEEIQGTNVGIIQTYIQNLTAIYHHDREFVNRVLGYIYSSKDGLSEYELLTLLSMDQYFIDKVAPTTFHNNITQELPLIHWARLYNNLKSFLSIKKKDNSELMYFFHREISRAISKEINLKEEHESIIDAVQSVIINQQKQSFECNRWGKLYITLITEYELRYQDNQKYQTFVTFLSDSQLLDYKWIEDCVYYIASTSNNYYINNEIKVASLFQSISVTITESLYRKDNDKWKYQYVSSLNLMAESHNKEGRFKEAIQLGEKAYELATMYYPQARSHWGELLVFLTNNLAAYHASIGAPKKIITLLEDALLKFREGEPNWNKSNAKLNLYATGLHTLGGCYYKLSRYDDAEQYLESSLELRSQLFQYDKPNWAFDFVEGLIAFAQVSDQLNRHDEAKNYSSFALKISEEFYPKNKFRWVGNYANSLKMLSTLISNDDPKQACINLRKVIDLLQEPYDLEPERWRREYASIINNLVTLSRESNDFFDGIIELAQQSLSLSEELNSLYVGADEAKLYTSSLNNLAIIAIKVDNDIAQGKKYLEKSYEFCKSFYGEENPSTKYTLATLKHVASNIPKPYLVTCSELIDTCLFHLDRLGRPYIDVELLSIVLDSVHLSPNASELFSTFLQQDLSFSKLNKGLIKLEDIAMLHNDLLGLKERFATEVIGTKK